MQVQPGVDIIRTNLEFLQEQFNSIAAHVLHCTDSGFGARLLELCNQGLFECLALNLHCLGDSRWSWLLSSMAEFAACRVE